ncbi:2-keto-4-pentenoate hydratase [Cytobacillus sp. FSL R7-0680]|uniref:2-keto-4-pentenoate hydratase n=1 Tax=Cytobacillus sp. FSL R7-0680 TaxID=2921689 RepID=UPI0030F61391
MPIDTVFDIKKGFHHLQNAYIQKKAVAPLSEMSPSLSIDDAYQVQLLHVENELKQGKIISGKKIGLTSKAIQTQLGVDEPDYGHLFHIMSVQNGATIKKGQVLQPKVEAEIAFKLAHDLKGPGVTTFDVIQATEYILPALEIIDSRIKDWQITLADTIADNASSGLYVLGNQPTNLAGIDLRQVGVTLYQNNEIANTGVGIAVLNHPAKCVAWLANKLAQYNRSLKAGEIILSGALSGAIAVQLGDSYIAKFSELGEVSIHFEN